MIRVLHYLRHLDIAGTTKTCQLFFEHASQNDFEVILVHEATGDKTRLEEFKNAVCTRKHVIEIDSYNGDPTSQPTSGPLQKVIDDFEIDVMHVYRSGFPEFPFPGDRETFPDSRPAHVFHDPKVSVPHFVETNIFGFLDLNAYIDRSLFMSKWLMDHCLAGKVQNIRAFAWPANRFDYVNNPVEMPRTDDTIETLSGEAIWLGRCGRPDNGIYNSVNVDAARLLRMQGYDVRFLVVAPPSNMILDLERYEIPHYVISPTVDPYELSKFYNSVDIYAHARADGETFGVNIAEAMIHGKPVVTHIATPSVPSMGVFQSQTELVDDGETGFIVNNDPAEYADALKKLIDNKEQAIAFGVAGKEKAMREYLADVCVNKLERIYKEIVN